MALLEAEILKVYYFTRAGAVKAVDDISFSVDKRPVAHFTLLVVVASHSDHAADI